MNCSLHITQVPGDPLGMASEHGRQVGIDHGGIAAPDKADQRADLVRQADSAQSRLIGCNLADQLLMLACSGSRGPGQRPGRGFRPVEPPEVGSRMDFGSGLDSIFPSASHAFVNFNYFRE
jgi:hypothetical protein